LGERHTPLANQHGIERILEPVEERHVIGRIGELLLRKPLRTPVGTLLLF
jgi:hypothetical protein